MTGKAQVTGQKKPSSKTICAPSTGQRLYIIAGLPQPYLKDVRQQVERELPPARVVTLEFPSSGSLYTPSNVGRLMQQSSTFVVSQRAGSSVMVPSRIVLVYVEDRSSSDLLNEFGHFCWTESSNIESCQLRGPMSMKSPEVARSIVDACKRGLDNSGMWMSAVAARGSHVIQLPPKNFILKEQHLSEILRAVQNGKILPQQLETMIVLRKFNQDAFPKARREFRAAIDHKGRVFVPDFSGHGLARSALEDDPRDLKAVLDQLFRLGCPLPEGCHFDVQLEGGRSFTNEYFDCTKKGSIVVKSGQHVNIYPNDFIRIGSECKWKTKNDHH